MAVSRSTGWLLCTSETLDVGKLDSLVVELVLLPKQDMEFDREESRMFAGDALSSRFSSSSNDSRGPKSVCTGDSSCDLICCRSLALRLRYLEARDAGESTFGLTSGASEGEFVFVFGFTSRLWGWP